MASPVKNFISDAEMADLEKKGVAKLAQNTIDKDFISDDEMSSLEASGKAKMPSMKQGAGQAFLESFGNTATLGNLPQLQAMAGKLMPDPNADLDERLRASGFTINQADPSYVEMRDENIRRMEQQKQAFPKATTAGTVAGIVGGGLGAGSLTGKAAATVGGRIVQASKTGAAMGALSNPGDVQGEIDPLQLEERTKNAVLGGIVGSLVQGGAESLGPVAKYVSGKLETKAAKKATRAVGRPSPNEAREMARTGQDVALGRELLDQGAIPVLGTPGRISKRVGKLKEKSWAAIDDLLSKGGDEAVIDGAEVGTALLDDPAVQMLRKTPGAEGAVKAIEDAAETFAKNGMMTLKDAQALKKSIDKQINYAKRIPDMQGKQEALFKSRTVLRDKMDEGVTKLGGEKGELRAAFKKQGMLEKASDIAEKEAGRQQANRSISLTDTIAGAAGASTGSPLLTLALGGLNKAGRTFGNSVQARGYDAASKLVAASPSLASMAKNNPVAFQALMHRISSPDAKLNPSSDPILNNPQLMEIFEQNPNLIDNVEDPKLKAELYRRIRKPAGK